MAKKKSDESLVVEDIDDEVVEFPATDSVELPTIESLDDVKELVNDGIDKIREASVDELKTGALKVGNRIFSAWRKLTDGD